MPFSFSIYSYNIAGKTETFARNFMIEILESQMQEIPDVFIFCFQEMSNHSILFQVGQDFLPNFEIISVQNGCQGTSKNFNLCTIVLQYTKKKQWDGKGFNKKPFQSRRLDKKCTSIGFSLDDSKALYFGNKGAIYTVMTVEREKYLIINTHAPFASQKGIIGSRFGGSYANFWELFIFSKIRESQMQGKTIIVGDLNSRSLINPKLNIQITPKIKNAVDSHFQYRQQTIDNPRPLMYKAQVQQLMNKAQNQSVMTPREIQNFQELTKRLKSGDFLSYFMEKNGGNFRDIDTINFLPTYKINENLKQYRLNKGEKLRLPGYTDRILTDIHPESIRDVTYKSIKKIGSDHFPVMANFTLFRKFKNIQMMKGDTYYQGKR